MAETDDTPRIDAEYAAKHLYSAIGDATGKHPIGPKDMVKVVDKLMPYLYELVQGYFSAFIFPRTSHSLCDEFVFHMTHPGASDVVGTSVVVRDGTGIQRVLFASTVSHVDLSRPDRHECGRIGPQPGEMVSRGPATTFAAPRDPWKHRSAGMSCATCMWFVEKTPQVDAGVAVKIGRCRRHAPTMNGYPAVFPTDWCGDHKLDETKL